MIQHNNTELTKLRASSGSIQHLASFNYSADAEQLAAIITRAERCEQELSYHCKKSRLLNTPGKPFLLRVSIPSSFTCSLWKDRLIKKNCARQSRWVQSRQEDSIFKKKLINLFIFKLLLVHIRVLSTAGSATSYTRAWNRIRTCSWS